MLKKLSLKEYPKVVTDLATQNHFLKILTYSLLGIFSVVLISMIFLLNRGPDVIALETSGAVAKIGNNVTESHVKAAVQEYVNYRYNWNNKTIDKNLKFSEGFVFSSLLDSFRKSMAEVKKFVKDKNVNQRVYPQTIDVDLKNKVAILTADRINEFDSLKAATILKVKFQLKLDDPTAINPWGIYISKELEGGD